MRLATRFGSPATIGPTSIPTRLRQSLGYLCRPSRSSRATILPFMQETRVSGLNGGVVEIVNSVVVPADLDVRVPPTSMSPAVGSAP
jgi:hypothetical protein